MQFAMIGTRSVDRYIYGPYFKLVDGMLVLWARAALGRKNGRPIIRYHFPVNTELVNIMTIYHANLHIHYVAVRVYIRFLPPSTMPFECNSLANLKFFTRLTIQSIRPQ